MEIYELFKKNKPNLSDSSIKQYVGQLKKIGRSINKELNKKKDVLDNIKEVIDYVKNINNKNTRKSYCAMLIVFLDVGRLSNESSNNSPKNSKSHLENNKFVKELRNIMTSDMDETRAEQITQKMNSKQKDNFVEWDEVLSTYHALTEHALPLFEKNKFNKREWTILLTYVLMTMLTVIPPRRSKDYTNFKIKNINKEEDNYAERSNLVFNDYKTSKTYGEQKVPLHYKIRTMLSKWKKINNTDWLLPQYNKDESITGPQLTRLLNDLFDKNVSTSMLRHSYLSHVYKDVPKIKEFEEMAKNLGTSVDMMLGTYVKELPKD